MVRYQNTALAGGAAVVLALRLLLLQGPSLTPLEASFARSLLGFNPYLHQPPPPSYPLYVALGKLVNFFVHDAFVALLAISVMASVVTFVLVARTTNFVAGLVAAFIPLHTVALPDAAAVACFAAAFYFWRSREPIALGIAAAAAVGVMPQAIFTMLLLMLAAARRWQSWAAFAAMSFAEFLQVVQNIELRRLRAFLEANTDLRQVFDPLGSKVLVAALLLAVTYHFLSAEAHDLAGDPDVQRRGEH